MQHFELNGQTRNVAGKAAIKAFRAQGLVPCNLYGLGMENILFTVNAKDLKAVTETPKAHIIDLVLDGTKKYTAVLHELQWHPVTDICLHVDFLAVNETKPINIEVPIVISGHAVGVQQGGKFYQNARKLRVCATMANLPDEVTVDISGLGLDKRIKAGDIKLDKIVVTTDKDAIICGVKTTRNTVVNTEEA
ncbi:MAG: 50S ribosomal protein L25 [Bacteroidales bacterium]|nr:50S ribosomal protein L25 [Bacteroidales bacterium]